MRGSKPKALTMASPVAYLLPIINLLEDFSKPLSPSFGGLAPGRCRRRPVDFPRSGLRPGRFPGLAGSFRAASKPRSLSGPRNPRFGGRIGSRTGISGGRRAPRLNARSTTRSQQEPWSGSQARILLGFGGTSRSRAQTRGNRPGRGKSSETQRTARSERFSRSIAALHFRISWPFHSYSWLPSCS
jgi:hypothetical protein